MDKIISNLVSLEKFKTKNIETGGDKSWSGIYQVIYRSLKNVIIELITKYSEYIEEWLKSTELGEYGEFFSRTHFKQMCCNWLLEYLVVHVIMNSNIT